jgi:hypothetical protein
LIISSIWTNVYASILPDRKQLRKRITIRFEEPMENGLPLISWVDKNVPENSIIASTDGQLTSYFLHRSGVSFVSSEYSTQTWDDNRVNNVMSKYNAEFLIVYRDTSGKEMRVVGESKFLAELIDGKKPAWLNLLAKNDSVLIYGPLLAQY